jgi:hypothetical protein
MNDNVIKNPLIDLIDLGSRQLAYVDSTPQGLPDVVRRSRRSPTASGTIDLLQLIDDAAPAGNGIHALDLRPVGQTVDLDPKAVITASSRVVQAGAELIIATKPPAPLYGSHDGLVGFYQQPALVRAIDPAPFAAVTDGESATSAATLPMRDALFTWDETPSAAFSVNVTRAQNIQLGGGEDLRRAILESILRGLGEYLDSLLLTAISATTPAAFTFGLAAARHLKYDQLRGLIGTSGNGASVIGNGSLRAGPGIQAELTAAHADTFIGAFGRAAVAIWPTLNIHATRMDAAGSIQLTCFTNAQAIVPDEAAFWTVAA